HVGIDSFTDRRRFSADMEALLHKIELRQDATIPGDWLHMRVTIDVMDTCVHTHTSSGPKGAWGQPPLTAAEHEVKLLECLRRGLSPEDAHEVLELLGRLEVLESMELKRVCDLIGRTSRVRDGLTPGVRQTH